MCAANQLTTSRSFSAHIAGPPDLKAERELSFSSYLEVVRHSPTRCRTAVARGLFSYLFRRTAGSTAESCEFDSLKNYKTSYRRLARLLGRDQDCLPAGEIEFLISVENRGVHPGTIALREYLFLNAFTSILAPERAIEIGTLAGFSAAIIAAALHRRHPHQKGVLVETIDRNTHSVVDADKPVGFQIPDIIPDFADAVWVRAPADSAAIRELARRDELEMIFIDADHQHPRPLLDLLRAAPYVQSGGWILLHDIKLGTIGRTSAEVDRKLRRAASFGAEWLFAFWPFRKIAGGNIGAVQIPPRKAAIVPTALRLMKLPFEMKVSSHPRVRRALYESIVPLLTGTLEPEATRRAERQ
jgi:predicted O-methyltransferase YrrM